MILLGWFGWLSLTLLHRRSGSCYFHNNEKKYSGQAVTCVWWDSTLNLLAPASASLSMTSTLPYIFLLALIIISRPPGLGPWPSGLSSWPPDLLMARNLCRSLFAWNGGLRVQRPICVKTEECFRMNESQQIHKHVLQDSVLIFQE